MGATVGATVAAAAVVAMATCRVDIPMRRAPAMGHALARAVVALELRRESHRAHIPPACAIAATEARHGCSVLVVVSATNGRVHPEQETRLQARALPTARVGGSAAHLTVAAGVGGDAVGAALLEGGRQREDAHVAGIVLFSEKTRS
eukprot:scaffold119039_cov48-Phaeocystis_antarctica.AAC.1